MNYKFYDMFVLFKEMWLSFKKKFKLWSCIKMVMLFILIC